MAYIFLIVAALVSCGNKSKDDKPTLIGGTVVPEGAFLPIVYISMSGSRCSATVVGERTLITAAHCARNNQGASFEYKRTRYTAKCTGHPWYPSRDMDTSLCLIDKKVEDMEYASIDFEPLEKDDVVTLTGYGCTSSSGNGGNDGKLRMGNAKVTGFTTYDIITKGLSASCYGDSGSSNYRGKTDGFGKLKVIGITSKGNINDTSYLSNLSKPEYKTWMEQWEKSNNTKICGVSAECGENEPEPEPEDPEEPANCDKEQALFSYYEEKTKKAGLALDACEAKQ